MWTDAVETRYFLYALRACMARSVFLCRYGKIVKKKLAISGLISYTYRQQIGNITNLMITKKLTILNKLGIHARPAAQFVRVASKFKSDVTVEKDDESVDGKSIMGLMMLAVGCGAVIEVSVDGADEEQAMAALEELVNAKFGEA